ncbi:MAG: putative rane protein [Gemmatimonadales bacterium]|nr:putative rane protein [Gemmatimonadales bacterium]
MRALLLHWVLNAAALWAAAAIVPGLEFNGGVGRLLLVAAVFGVVNTTLRPLLTILTCPLIIITLGLFTLVINALMLLVTGWLSESWNLGFTVMGFWAAFWGGLVVGLVSMALSLLLPAKANRPYAPHGPPPSVR